MDESDSGLNKINERVDDVVEKAEQVEGTDMTLNDERRPVDMADEAQAITGEAAEYVDFLINNQQQIEYTKQNHLELLKHLLDQAHENMFRCQLRLEEDE
jgi:DNA-binding ferritin-like protein